MVVRAQFFQSGFLHPGLWHLGLHYLGLHHLGLHPDLLYPDLLPLRISNQNRETDAHVEGDLLPEQQCECSISRSNTYSTLPYTSDAGGQRQRTPNSPI